MRPDLASFLALHDPVAEEGVAWRGGQLAFRVTTYFGRDLPPLDSVTSVRSLVFRSDSLIVIRDPETRHILPGGRRGRGEGVTETLRRELLEETGWTIRDPLMLGWMHFHHLSPKPPGYRYPHPDFLQLVHTSEAAELLPGARHTEGYEIEAVFRPIAEIQALELSPSQRLFLNAALRAR